MYMSKKLFDFAIGNPPYMETKDDTSDTPIYNDFMDSAFEIADKVELITPARFLFNAGKTPAKWNDKMLNDEHFKVLHYEEKSVNVFPTAKIRGGVAITYRDINRKTVPIKVFSPFPVMNQIVKKVLSGEGFESLSNMMVLQNKLDLSALYEDYPNYKNLIGSKGKERRLDTGIFEKLPLFSEEKTDCNSVKIYGVVKKKRIFRYFPLKYLDLNHNNFDKYKTVIMKSNGEGIFGEVIADADVLEPFVGYTQSFIGIGSFEDMGDAENCRKYLKTKFARALLDVKKVTQDNPPDTWYCVPVQDFSISSDINWNASIKNIDKQLYKKYGLSDEEINFIETNVKEME